MALALAFGAATHAHATPVSFVITGQIPAGTDTAFPVGSSNAVTVHLSYDPDLASAAAPGQEFQLEPSAQWSAQWGDVAVAVTGADGIAAQVHGWDIFLRVFLPAGTLPFTTHDAFMLMSVGQPNQIGPGPFEGLTHLPANLDAANPVRDSSVWLTTLQANDEQVHGDLATITRVPEPGTVAILAVGLVALGAWRVAPRRRRAASTRAIA